MLVIVVGPENSDRPTPLLSFSLYDTFWKKSLAVFDRFEGLLGNLYDSEDKKEKRIG